MVWISPAPGGMWPSTSSGMVGLLATKHDSSTGNAGVEGVLGISLKGQKNFLS